MKVERAIADSHNLQYTLKLSRLMVRGYYHSVSHFWQLSLNLSATCIPLCASVALLTVNPSNCQSKCVFQRRTYRMLTCYRERWTGQSFSILWVLLVFVLSVVTMFGENNTAACSLETSVVFTWDCQPSSLVITASNELYNHWHCLCFYRATSNRAGRGFSRAIYSTER